MSSSYNDDQRAKRELAYMKRIKQTMQPKSNEERAKEIAAEKKPMTRAEKTTNFLYYNKVRIIVIALTAVIGSLLLINYFSAPKYDTSIMAAYVEDGLDTKAIAAEIAKYAYDSDQNGTVSIQINDVCLSANQFTDLQTTQYSKRVAYIQLGSVALYLLDDNQYRDIVGEEPSAFVNMKNLYPDNPNADACRFNLDGTEFAKDLGDVLPEGFCFVLRTEDHAGSSGDKVKYEVSKQILDNIVYNHKTAE